MKKSPSQLLTGLLVLGFGVGLLLHTLNIVDLSRIAAHFWPLFVIAVGFIALVGNPRRWVWPGAIVTFGVLLLLGQLGFVNFNIWALILPAIIILVGLSLIFKSPRWGITPETTEPVDKLSVTAIFSGNKQIGSASFKGGEVTALFGGAEIDLRDAQIETKAHIDVFVALGGAELRVPTTWRVQVNGTPILGGWEDKTKVPADKKAPVLSISGTCIMGGITITN